MTNDIEEFRIDVPDDVLDDLAARLARSRPPATPVRDGGESTETITRIEELVAYWRDGYDWRAAERRLNAYPHHRATVDGAGLHFLHVPGKGPDPLPLLLSNGWPSSFVEYLPVLQALTDPAAAGGDPADSFSVVVPAHPGYGFSDSCAERDGVSREWIADLYDRLMTERLGYRRYVAHGDDIGGGVVSRLGLRHPETVASIQVANWMMPRLGPDTPALTLEEEAYQANVAEWRRTEGAYAHVQATRPQILSYALNDSPLGLAAWILEKYFTWSDPATRDRLSADDLLTTVMIYWVTGTIGSSARLYAVAAKPPEPGEAVTVPTSILVPREPRLMVPPEAWLRRVYPRLDRYRVVDEGGHFLALEATETFVDAVRDAFRPYRTV